jgi:hypothetical protein
MRTRKADPGIKEESVKITSNIVTHSLTGEKASGERVFFISTTRFLCLPDTVDPRGPKGGK